MSHVSCGSGRVRDNPADLEALRRACEERGLELHLGVETYKWFGKWVNDYSRDDAAYRRGVKPEDYGKCTHMIRVKGAPAGHYEAGLVRMSDGGFAVVFDHWSAGPGARDLAARLGWDGDDSKALVQGVSKYKVVLQAEKLGHRVKSVETLADGKIRVVLGVKQAASELGGGGGDLR